MTHITHDALRAAILAVGVVVLSAAAADAQDLVPGAYTPAPVGANVLTLIAGGTKGDVLLDPALPVEDAKAAVVNAGVGLARTFNLAGRYANVGVIVPIVHAHVEAVVTGAFQEAFRTGQGDIGARLAFNLYGARAMTLQQFATYRPTTIVGVSVVVVIPTGQYDSSRFVNISTHRWVVKPEVGVSRRRGRWTVEGDFGATFFADNTNFLNGGLREQTHIGSVQGHLTYAIRPGFWVAGDGNFWRGGRVITNGVDSTDEQRNSRLGVTFAVPIKRQQVRIAYSYGAYTRVGGDFKSIGVSYSYIWARRH